MQAIVVKTEGLEHQLKSLQTTSKKKDQQIVELVKNQSQPTIAKQLAEREQQTMVSKLQGMEQQLGSWQAANEENDQQIVVLVKNMTQLAIAQHVVAQEKLEADEAIQQCRTEVQALELQVIAQGTGMQ